MFAYKKDDFNVPIKVRMQKKAYYSDEGMVEQCESLAKLPFVYKYIALTPDGHLGY